MELADPTRTLGAGTVYSGESVMKSCSDASVRGRPINVSEVEAVRIGGWFFGMLRSTAGQGANRQQPAEATERERRPCRSYQIPREYTRELISAMSRMAGGGSFVRGLVLARVLSNVSHGKYR